MDTNDTTSSLGGALSRSTTRNSSRSRDSSMFSRRVWSLPGRGLSRRVSNTSSVGSEASGLSRVRSNVSNQMARLRSGGSRFFGQIMRRSRSHENNLGHVKVGGPYNPRHVSFAEQPELEHLSEQRSPHWSQPRPPTPPPRLLALVDDGGNDSDGTLADEDIALLPTSHGADDYFYARNEWWRSSDEYYALAFPWF